MNYQYTKVVVPSDFDLLKAIGDIEAQEIKSAATWEDELVERATHGKQILGDKMPWAKTDYLFRFRPGELTIWGGINGHMKSMISGQCALWLARHSRVCIASLEMAPTDTLDRMARQSAGCKHGPTWARQFSRWAAERLFIYDQTDTLPPDRILGMAVYCATQLKCQHIFIDSLMKCGTDEDKVVEKQFVDRLAWIAKTCKVHIHLVCHVRKPQHAGEEYQPTKFDVKGSGSIVDLTCNLLLVWKDKKRESLYHKITKGQPLTEAEQTYYDKSCDQLLTVAKQRHGDWEGEIALWFNRESLQFTESNSTRAMPFSLGG